MSLIDLSPPIIEPIDLAQAKNYLRVDTNDDDILISNLIGTIRHMVENELNLCLIERRFIYRTNIPQSNCLTLPRPPLMAVNRISLIGENDQAVDIPPADYSVTTKRDPGEIRLNKDKSWHQYQAGFSSLEIEFTAGFGSNADAIPLPIKQAILLGLTHAYEYRAIGQIDKLPLMATALLAPYKKVRL